MTRLFCLLVIALSVLTLATVAGTDEWWVRLFDFPRQQLFVALLVAGIAAMLARPRGAWLAITLVLWIAALGWNGMKVAPYLSFLQPQLPLQASCPAESRVRVLAANVRSGNQQSGPLRTLLAEAEPDIFLAMETDPWWDGQLADISAGFGNELQQVANADTHFGIHLMSRLELVSGGTPTLATEAVPSVNAVYRLPGGQVFRFVGLHPKPPDFFQDSTLRDEQLMAGARLMAQSAEPSVVAGDFNATPWEATFRRFVAEARLSDPRRGRGFYNTYQLPLFGRVWPIDHVLVQAPIGLAGYRRGPDIGSDHLPLIADLCVG